jgi:hypothetical protein
MDRAELTETEIGGIKIPKPQSNSYQASAALSTEAVKSKTTTLGHNNFRPDVYRVTEGYIA